MFELNSIEARSEFTELFTRWQQNKIAQPWNNEPAPTSASLTPIIEQQLRDRVQRDLFRVESIDHCCAWCLTEGRYVRATCEDALCFDCNFLLTQIINDETT